MKIETWLNSGANAQSCKRDVIDTDDLGISDDEWNAMDDDQKEAVMKPVIFDSLDWGFHEQP